MSWRNIEEGKLFINETSSGLLVRGGQNIICAEWNIWENVDILTGKIGICMAFWQ